MSKDGKKKGCCDIKLPKLDIECGNLRDISPNERKQRMIKNPYWLKHQADKAKN
jgi:hypothetical protein